MLLTSRGLAGAQSSSGSSSSIGGLSLPSSLSDLPSLLSKEYRQQMVEKELRKMIINWAAEANKTAAQKAANPVDDDDSYIIKPGAQLVNGRRMTSSSYTTDYDETTEFSEQGDWDLPNEILSSINITIPNITLQQDLLGFTLTIQVNGSCSNIAFGDIILDWDKGEGNKSLAYKAQVLKGRVKCLLMVDWNTGVLDVQDTIKMKVVVNDVNVGVALDLLGAPPTTSQYLGCRFAFQLGDIATTGGFSSNIINELNYLVIGALRDDADGVSSLVCDLVRDQTDALDDLFKTLNDALEPYVNKTANDVDPLDFENNLDPPETLVDFTDDEGFGNVVNVLLNNIAGVINADQINTLVEENLLDDNKTLAITLEEEYGPDATAEGRSLQGEESNRTCSPLGDRRRLARAAKDFFGRRLQDIEGLDNITIDGLIDTENFLEINELTPVEIRVYGLNNFSDASPLSAIGKQTLSTELSLYKLYLEADVYVDALVNNITVQYLVTIGVEIEDIFINATYVIGLSEAEVNEWTVGTFLDSDNLTPCIASAIVVGGVSQLDVTVGFIGTPSIQGLISPGLNELANTGVESIVCAYQDLILDSIPGLVQNNGTKLINDYIECLIEVEGPKQECNNTSLIDALLGESTLAPTSDIEFDFPRWLGEGLYRQEEDGKKVRGYIDFRDLLLPPDEAKAMGGSGRQQYGDVIALAFSGLQEQLTTIDVETGLPGINSFLPEEELAFDYEIEQVIDTTNTSYVYLLLQSITLAAYNARVQNLNTIVNPLTFFQPTRNAHVVTSLFNFGPLPDALPSRSLNGTVTTFFELNGTDSPFAMINELDAAVRIGELDFFADFQIMISEIDFISFPLRDSVNIDCWFALMPSTGPTAEMNSFEIKKLLVDIVSLSINFKCLNCTSTLLPGAIEAIEDTGGFVVLGDRMGPLIEELATIKTLSPFVTDTLGVGDESARKCPHQALYNTTSNETDSTVISLPALSNSSVDTVVYSGILAFEVFGVVIAEAHITNNVSLSDPLSGQESFNMTGNDTNLLDWFRLNDTFIGPFADSVLDGLRESLGGVTEEGELGVNGLVEDGIFNATLDMMVELADGYNLTIDTLQVMGLDTFTLFDVLQPIAPQTLENNIAIANLTIVIDFSINVTTTSDPPLSYRMSFDVEDVNVTVYLFTAIDMDKVENLTIGSLLFVENFIPCLFSAAYDIHVPAMRATIGNLSEPTFEGLLPETDAAATASLAAIFSQYRSVFINATNSIFDSTVRVLANEFITEYIESSPACPESGDSFNASASVLTGTDAGLIDLRDLLLPPDEAILFGGSGLQPYGDLVATGYGFLLDLLETSEEGELLEINSNVESFTENQSGVVGMMRLEDELFSSLGNQSFDFLANLTQMFELRAFDARIRNLNTIVSPAAVAYPTADPFAVETVINLGPIVGKALNATIGFLLSLEGDLTSLDMYNMFDFSGKLAEVDVVALTSIFVQQENLFRFPLRDIFEVDCWLSLLQTPDEATNTSAFKIESLLTKLASLSTELDCYNCTSRVLSAAVEIADGAGASLTFGDRLGFLIEDIATGDSVESFIVQSVAFGDKAGRSCPHHPLFNTTSIEKADANLTLPILSSLSVDTTLFAAAVFVEIAIIVGADNHLLNPGVETYALEAQDAFIVPNNTKMVNWTNLDNASIPFLAEALDFVRSALGDMQELDDGSEELGVNGYTKGLMDENGIFEMPLNLSLFNDSGVLVQINAVRARGLDSFTMFDILEPIAAQTMQNNISLDNLTLHLDISVDFLENGEAPNHFNMTFNMEYINATVPIFAAVDEYLLGNLTVGQLLHMSNLLPCILGTTYGVEIQEMIVTAQYISEPVFEGLLTDTSESLAKTTSALYAEFADLVKESLPLVFQDTIRVIINAFLASYEEGDCIKYPTNTTLPYIDFREMFRPSNVSGYSPYGDIIPIIREITQESLYSENPETGMPKINDVLIAPFTKDQSGVEGTLDLPGKLFGFEIAELAAAGVGLVDVEFYDGRIENLDTVGEPLEVLEPNYTRAELLDNRATFGTQFRPLRFAVRSSLSMFGPYANSRDEMDIFGELRSAPIFAVSLARIGAQEFLNFPLGYAGDVDCWLGTLAEPALDQIEAGNKTVNPVLSLDYLEVAYESMRISASCVNCTTGGLLAVPDLLEILEITTAKNVLGYRNTELLVELVNSDFGQRWILRIFQNSLEQCEYTSNVTSVHTEYEDPDLPVLSDYHMETGVFTVTVMIQLGLVIMAETIKDAEDVEPLMEDPEPVIPPGTRLVDFTALDEYPNGALLEGLISTINSQFGTPSVDEETGETTLGVNDILGNPIQPFDEFEWTEEVSFGFSGVLLNMKKLTISGLDTFTRFSIANITGPTTLQSQFGWERLQLDFELEVEFEEGDFPNREAEDLRRKLQKGKERNNIDGDGRYPFFLTIEMVDVLFDGTTFVALDYELLKYVELGSFLRMGSILTCLQAAVLHLEFTDVLFTVGRITKMQVTGFESDDTIAAAENLEEVLVEKYGESIAGMAPTVMKAALRPYMNQFIDDALKAADAKCDEFQFEPSTEGFVDFRDLFLTPEESIEHGGTGLAQYGDLVSTVYLYSNVFITFFLLPEIDSFELPGAIFDGGIKFDVRSFQSVAYLKISDLSIQNINSVRSLEYTKPIEGEAFMLNNSANFGVGRKTLEIKLRVMFVFKGLGAEVRKYPFSWRGSFSPSLHLLDNVSIILTFLRSRFCYGRVEDFDISNDFEITFDIKNLNVVAAILAKMREEDFVRFPMRDITKLNCWLATIPPPELDKEGYRVPGQEPTLSVEELFISMKEMNMRINCFNCSSPGLKEWNDVLSQPGVSDELTASANATAQVLADRFGDEFLQDFLDRLLVEAPKQCPHKDNYDPDSPPFQSTTQKKRVTTDNEWIIYLSVVLIPVIVALVTVLAVRMIVIKRHKKWLTTIPSEQVFLLQQKQEKEDHMESELNELTQSMYHSPEVSTIARYTIPVILVVNIGFFLSGHLNVGGRALIDFTFAGVTYRVDNFFEFSIAQGTLDMWHAGGEELAALILLFSGVWPYTKQLITLALWFLPPSVVSISRRGQFLLWLDILAKWSMIDIFTLLVTCVGFR